MTLVNELPRDVDLVVLGHHVDAEASLREKYQKLVDEDRFHFVNVNGASSFWTRDAVPIPVFRWLENAANNLMLVDSKYYHGFDSDDAIADKFMTGLLKNLYYFEGGNFIADTKGRCLIVNNSRHAEIPNENFKKLFGCESLTRLPFVAGIGHIDERVKLISDEDALTDLKEYREPLEKLGFRVTLLPRADNAFETYVNSLLINGTLFLPIFDEKEDDEAIRVYEGFGLRVVPIKVKTLPNSGAGSIHCITMTYPPAPRDQLEAQLRLSLTK